MYRPRRIESLPERMDADGLKLYTISPRERPVDADGYLPALNAMKQARNVSWSATPAFAIFHDGAQARYLVLGWWGNDNEMFLAVAADDGSGWVEDMSRYSFCLWDMEVMWHERNAFVEYLYGATPNVAAYRAARLCKPAP